MQIKPMIFNSDMVRALLEGRKTQTRRPVKHQPFYSTAIIPTWVFPRNKADVVTGESGLLYPNGKELVLSLSGVSVGDLIYVRETFVGPLWDQDAPYPENGYTNKYCEYKADNNQCPEYVDIEGDLQCTWKPSIHMPRWASRLTLKVIGVRVERVQDISDDDCWKEAPIGLSYPVRSHSDFAVTEDGPKRCFKRTWESIYAGSWNRNDWVWVIEFEVIRQNVDEYLAGLK